MVPAKCLLQLICRKGYGWDDGVSYEIFDQWQRWFADLQIITKLEIPAAVDGWLLLRRAGLSSMEYSMVMSQLQGDLTNARVGQVLEQTFGQ